MHCDRGHTPATGAMATRSPGRGHGLSAKVPERSPRSQNVFKCPRPWAEPPPGDSHLGSTSSSKDNTPRPPNQNPSLVHGPVWH